MTYPVTSASGDTHWYQNGERHRSDGPAVEWSTGDKEWFRNGERHRLDGPAIIYANGDKEWWVDSAPLTPAEFAAKMLDKETALLWKMSGYCWPFDFGLTHDI
jgi:hypothetical protein